MAYIKSQYDNSTPTAAAVSQSEFIKTFELFLSRLVNYRDPNIKEEFHNIKNYFKDCPDIYQEENFYKVINISLNRIDVLPTIKGQEYLYELLEFIQLEQFNKLIPHLAEYIDQRPVFNIICHCLSEENIKLTETLLNVLLLKENRDIRKIRKVGSYLASKTRLNFLLDNFEHWDDPTVVASYFKNNNLETKFISKLISKTGQLNSKYRESFQLILSKDIPFQYVYNFFENHVELSGFIPEINNYYIKAIENKTIKIEDFKTQNGKMYNLFNDTDYLKKWANDDISHFLLNVFMLFQENILSKDNLKTTIIQYLSDHHNNTFNYKTNHRIIKLLKSLDYDFKSEAFSNILKSPHYLTAWQENNFNNFEENMSFFVEKGAVSVEDICNYLAKYFLNRIPKQQDYVNSCEILAKYNYDFTKDEFFVFTAKAIKMMHKEFSSSLPLDKNKIFTLNNKQTTLNDILIENDNYYVLLEIFNQKMDKESFNTLCKTSQGYDLSNFKKLLTSNQIEKFYTVSRADTSPKEFFTNWFLQAQPNIIFDYIRQDFLALFLKENNKIFFNLPKENPILTYMSNYIITDNSSFNYYEKTFAFRLNELFKGELWHLEGSKPGKSIYEQYNDIVNELIESKSFVIKPAPIRKKNFLSFFTKQEITPDPLQCQLMGETFSIITDPDLVMSTENNIQTTIKGSLDSLIETAYNDINNLNQTLNKYNDNNLNIEVKIRAENLLLNNVNFLKHVQSQGGEIGFEDSYFLNNNLGKYLNQCLQVYGKAVIKYEAMENPANKKIFSKYNEEDIEKFKEKIDTEAIKQLSLLEKELELVKEHILQQIDVDILHDMKVNTRILQNRVEEKETSNDRVFKLKP